MSNIFKAILVALFIPTACCTAQTKFKALVVNDWLQAGSLTISGGANIVGELLEDSAINANQISTPSNPAAGRNKLYFKSDDKLYRLTSGGSESEVGAAAGANTALSNLTATSVNQDLIPSSISRALGSASSFWDRLFTTDILFRSSGVSIGVLDSTTSPLTLPSGNTAHLNLMTSDVASPNYRLGIWTNNQSGSQDIGDLYIETGNHVGAVSPFNTGDILTKSGDVTNAANTGSSGDLIYEIGTTAGGGPRGNIKFLDGTEGIIGECWISSGTGGEGNWDTCPDEGATTALDNLASVDLNENLTTTKASPLSLEHLTPTFSVGVSTANNGAGASGAITISTGTATTTRGSIQLKSLDLIMGDSGTVVVAPASGGEMGKSAVPWLFKGSNYWGMSGGAIQFELNAGSVATPSSGSVNGTIKTNTGTGFTIYSVSQAGNTGPLSNETGNSSSFASGDIKRQTGTANTTSGNIIDRTGTAGTVRGKHLSDTRLLDVTSAAVFVKVTADPCADTSAFPEGALFYNDTSDYYCFCDGGGADQQMHAPTTACF